MTTYHVGIAIEHSRDLAAIARDLRVETPLFPHCTVENMHANASRTTIQYACDGIPCTETLQVTRVELFGKKAVLCVDPDELIRVARSSLQEKLSDLRIHYASVMPKYWAPHVTLGYVRRDDRPAVLRNIDLELAVSGVILTRDHDYSNRWPITTSLV
jgi:2'-5' RNA ligase